MLDSIDRKTRQERTRSLLNQFIEEKLSADIIEMKLYPKEFDRVKKEFPNLNFRVVATIKSVSYKKYKVQITK